MRNLVATALVATAVVVAACGGGQGQPTAQTPPQASALQNSGFEEGRDPWFSLKPPHFILSEEISHTGQASALLEMRTEAQDEGTKVYYLVQEITPTELPEVMSGFYRVGNWTRGTPLQYLQFVVIVMGANNLPGGFPNHQIRYLLAGIDREPFQIANAHFIFLSREDPPLNRWVPFEVNVREDFQNLWGSAPEGYEKIRVLFEVRYDDKSQGETPEADVYYDDLYFGPAQ